MSIIHKALDFAAMAHKGQTRKYTGEPYIVHPCAVAGLVRSVTTCNEAVAAALLHDVVEDCGVSLGYLAEEFGVEVAAMVMDVTDVSRPGDGNRATRKRLDLEHIAKGGRYSQTIKLADLIDNTKSIVLYDPEFSKVYLREKAALLEVLTKGDKTLLEIARKMVTTCART